MYGTKKSRHILGQRLAISAVRLAIKKGILLEINGLDCIDCGNPAKHYDHRDYNKPLDVVPVCVSCNCLRGPAIARKDFECKHKKTLDEIDVIVRSKEVLREDRIKLRGKSMDIYFYRKSHVKSHVEKLCMLANTKYSWFDLCARGHGEFSVKTAIDLEAASRVIAEYEGDFMTVEEIFNIDAQVKDRIEVIKMKIIEKAKVA